MKKDITTFKIRINSIDTEHVFFRLYAGYGLESEHALSQDMDGQIVLDVRQFVDFALRLVAFVYMERTPEKEEQKVINKSMKIIIFDNIDPQKAKPITPMKLRR